MYARTYVCVSAYVCMHVCAYTHAHVGVYMHVCECMCARVWGLSECMHVCVRVCD